MSSQSVMSSKETSYHPGLSPVKGQKFDPGTQTRSRDAAVERNSETKNRCAVFLQYISGPSFTLHGSCKLVLRSSALCRMCVCVCVRVCVCVCVCVVTDTAEGSTAPNLQSSSKHCYQRTGLATDGTDRKMNPYECKGVKCSSWNCLVLTNYTV
jgi:hypothetical protein